MRHRSSDEPAASSKTYRKVNAQLSHRILHTQPFHSHYPSADFEAIVRHIEKRMRRSVVQGFFWCLKRSKKITLSDNDFKSLQKLGVSIRVVRHR